MPKRMIDVELTTLDKAVYFAPRGRVRLLHLGGVIAKHYLHPDDLLVGFVGDAGAGKSLLIRGMFPGLVLTNDDEGINVRPLPVLKDFEDGRFTTSTYHVDIRFEMAFTQAWRLGEAIREAVRQRKRVVVEHWDLIHPSVGLNANVLVGIGEEVVVHRPNVFGPDPKEVAARVFASLKYRKMAHSAEDLVTIVLNDLGIDTPELHSDIFSGFVIDFDERPDVDFVHVEAMVKEYIRENRRIAYCDEEHIEVGDRRVRCSGPRIHVRRAGEIEGFRLAHEPIFDPHTNLWHLPGWVGTGSR